jgi:septum formation protein
MRTVILASQSKQRKEIMKALGIPFEIKPADIDEKVIRDENLTIRAEKIARAKAEKIAKENQDAIVIAADTFNAIREFVLEKPKTIEEAKTMLLLQSGKMAKTYTGFCYIDQQNGINVSKTLEIDYTVRPLSNQEIDEYIADNPVLTWSAAFAPANTKGLVLIANMTGSMTGFTHGLPVEELVPLLKRSNIEY